LISVASSTPAVFLRSRRPPIPIFAIEPVFARRRSFR
jgi:hypothetical protein